MTDSLIVFCVILCAVSGCSTLAYSKLNSKLNNLKEEEENNLDQEILKRVRHLSYQKIAADEDIFWDDLNNICETESNKIVGYTAVLSNREGHEIVSQLSDLCEKNPPTGVNWKMLLYNLKRSLPEKHWTDNNNIKMGRGVGIVGFLAFVMLSFSFALLVTLIQGNTLPFGDLLSLIGLIIYILLTLAILGATINKIGNILKL